MEHFLTFSSKVSILAIALVVLILPVYGQINTQCTPSLLSSFTPCLNFITNSTSNGTSPTPGCCSSLKTITSNSMDCFCLIVTGNVPFQMPINRTLAISLPRACNMAGVPVQCKASGSPLPAPGPVALGPTLSPAGSPPASPTASPVVPEPTPSALSPESDTTPTLTPPAPTVTTGTTTGSRPVLTPPASAASSSYNLSPSTLLFAIGLAVIKFY